MLLRQMFKEIYYYKIKRMKPHEYLFLHLRKTGMQIGENCWFFSDKIETSEPYLVTIGNNVMIAPDVRFTTHDASASYYIPGASDLFGRINIGNECFIGMGAIILPGVTIADRCIIGAGGGGYEEYTRAWKRDRGQSRQGDLHGRRTAGEERAICAERLGRAG